MNWSGKYMKKIKIKTKTIQIDQFLKWANIVTTGGEAKKIIKAGKVYVNGELEARRSHKLQNKDIVEISGIEENFQVSR